MKKIMFNERYGLQQAVMNGSKTMTRRIVKFSDEELALIEQFPEEYLIARYAQYKVGEVVAIAQSYEELENEVNTPIENNEYGIHMYFPKDCPGWKNKMFVRPELMLHHIKITDVRFERLQNISDEDCMKEGVLSAPKCYGPFYTFKGSLEPVGWRTPREAFASLIDKVSGKGTWDKNPWVIAYTFEIYYKLLHMQGTFTGGPLNPFNKH